MVLGASGQNTVTSIARVVMETSLVLEHVLNLKPSMVECFVQVLAETTWKNVMRIPAKVSIGINKHIWDVGALLVTIFYFGLFSI